MTAKQDERTLDHVLFRFHREVTNPTPAIVVAWSRDYPEYAAEIQAHAIEMLDLESRATAQPPDLASLEAEARSAAINAVFEANQQDAAPPAAYASLREAAAQAGLSLRDLADNIGLARAVVADVNSGGIMPETINVEFFRAVSPQIKQNVEGLRGLVAQPRPIALPQAVAFKAAAAPSVGKPRTWRDAINASDMPDDIKAYWLSDED
jgi:hypothetical protein